MLGSDKIGLWKIKHVFINMCLILNDYRDKNYLNL